MILDNFNGLLKYSLKTISVLLFLTGTSTLAQQTDVPPQKQSRFMDNVRFGGNIGLSFGNGFFTGMLAPSAIYDVNRYFSTGIGIIGSYTDGRNFKSAVYGPSALFFFRPYQGFRLSAEYEQLRVNQTIELTEGDIEDNFWNPALFLGAGFTTGNITAGIRYNVLFDDDDGVYGSALIPFIGVFF
ncbi:hypothetical protein GCM10009117_06800 [Gangjinia marincola]|uniref:Outer membrane protein beta-barrel domain-containing protein n=2 Tax=Gangjinia marincola TaxID=578463 RepID=A0ABP3XQK8_9FLAO